ncbi:hypothetical protein ABB37_08505 [Leptomonas pyrrhocoris]|uniref:Uncharacterized protein n=1 Tax=Leptomonas pyrrhocoris TaxID=157538 RepID=A0A0M9FSW5_LEPPY|nr:hypothetical protein ABB37_08505 [Leptomonas pyrrhocoris]KPA75186.1 hypothetical protein ABB37_08505 [Leptomonas pyrrhocoris]|eukprot:XP_015653625.1 hypothetical protein ABB37_08505 [Leptomonas pyrrhocoris]
MSAADRVFISGTPLAQFVSAAYACSPGFKHIHYLYGLRQSAHELTDRQENAEKSEVVILGATAVDSMETPSGLMKLGFLTICEAPAHKLSYEDTQRAIQASSINPRGPNILFHFTKITSNDGIVRVLYTLYECRQSSVEPLRPLKLSIDNLVDSLQGFTKISNVFMHNTPSDSANRKLTAAPESVMGGLETDAFHDVETLAREKAVLVKRIVELTNELNTQSRSS